MDFDSHQPPVLYNEQSVNGHVFSLSSVADPGGGCNPPLETFGGGGGEIGTTQITLLYWASTGVITARTGSTGIPARCRLAVTRPLERICIRFSRTGPVPALYLGPVPVLCTGPIVADRLIYLILIHGFNQSST